MLFISLVYAYTRVPAARTEAAAKMACAQCTHDARCSNTPPHSVNRENNPLSSGNDVIDINVDIETTVECSCDHFSCARLAERKLCGTDGITYRSECHLKRKACLQQTDIYKLHDGVCQTQREHCLCLCVRV